MKKSFRLITLLLIVTFISTAFIATVFANTEDTVHFSKADGSIFVWEEDTVLYTKDSLEVAMDWDLNRLYLVESLDDDDTSYDYLWYPGMIGNDKITINDADGNLVCYYYPNGKPASTDIRPTGDNTLAADTASNSIGNYRGLVAHWKFDGDLKDASQFKNDGINIGKITYVDSIFGKGAKFEGKSYIEVKDSAALDLEDAFTFSLWIYKEDMRKKDVMEGGVPYLMKMDDNDLGYPYGAYEWNTMTPAVVYTSQDEFRDISADKAFDIQKWTLLTITYDGQTMKIYKNDELVKSELLSATLVSSSSPLYIGFSHFMTVDNYYKGIMDDLRIYNQALSYEAVEELFDAGVKGSGKNLIVKPNKLVAFYKFEGNANDLSGFGNNGKAINAKGGITYVAGTAGKGAKFNGSSYFEVPDSDSLDIDEKFTIGTWIYKEATKTNQPIIAKYGESHNKRDTSYQLYDSYDGSGPYLHLRPFEEDSSGSQGTYPETMNKPGKWYYYTTTYDGKNLKTYVDGVLIQTAPYEGTLSHSSGPLWIGATTDTIFFKGVMDEMRIYNYAFNAEQVRQLYGLRDKLVVSSADVKVVVLNTMKLKQVIQLKALSLTHKYTSPNKALTNGKDELITTNVTATAVFKSSNPKIVSVSNKNKLTAIKKGTAIITVTNGTLTTSYTVTVK